MSKIKLGIMGAGGISRRVARGIKESRNCELAFVASRDESRAQSLAGEFGVENYGDYQQLFQADIAGVYLATINELHYQQIKLCLKNNKHVICEKPMLVNSEEAEELYALADANEVFLLEAMKCRYLPTIAKVRELLKKYEEPKHLLATFCRREPYAQTPLHNFGDPRYGGALKDVGCYVISWALELFAADICASHLQQTTSGDVDLEAWLYLKNTAGLYMQLGCSVLYDRDNLAVISGDGYQIKVRDFWKSYDIEVWKKGTQVERFKEDIGSEFAYQVDHFGEVIKKAVYRDDNRRELEFIKRVIACYPTTR